MGRGLGQPFRRKDKSGWWFRWTDPATKLRLQRWFPNKGIADNFRSVLLHRRFADCIPGGIPVTVAEAVKDYLQTYDVRGLRPSAKTEARLTLEKFQESFRLIKTTAISQKAVDQFVTERINSGQSRWTTNKNIANLKAFLTWCHRQRYIAAEFSLAKIKVERRIVKALTNEQIRAVLAACPTEAWRVRVLLSLCTGLRKNDIDNLPASAVDLKNMAIDLSAIKTSKTSIGMPLPKALKRILKPYCATRQNGPLFPRKNVRKDWDALRIKAKLSKITRQDFRRTCYTLMQMVGSPRAAQEMLQHSDLRIGEFYSDASLLLRWQVNQLPVKEWLKPPEEKAASPRR